mgnify:CR=1 FL=1
MSGVLDVDATNWEGEVLQSDTLVVVDFWHDQCPWCRMLDPIYSAVADEYKGKVKFAKLNALASHENQHLAIHYGVMSTPTVVFFCAGRPIAAVMGYQTKDRLKQLVETVIKNHKECIKKSTELKTT